MYPRLLNGKETTMQLRRLAVATLMFLGMVGAVLLPTLVALYREISQGKASGIIVGSPAENSFRMVVLLFLAVLAFWLSGKLVRAYAGTPCARD